MQNILVYGTILFDHIKNEYFIGGCHTNVAAHCAKLGMDTTMVSCVGEDDLGRRAVEWMKSIGIHTEYIRTDSSHPTGRVEVELSDLENPRYLLLDDVAYDYVRVEEESLRKLESQEFDFLYFSTSEQRHQISADTLYKLLDSLRVRNRFCDLNIRENCYTMPRILTSLERTDILKVNEEELEFLATCVLKEHRGEQKAVKALMQTYSIRIVIVTRGERGASAYEKGRRIDMAGVPTKVADTIGAGDGFSAAFINKYAGTGDIEAALRAGVYMGSYVSGRRAAIPEYTEEILRRVQ